MSSRSEHSPDRIAALDGGLEAGRSANIESIGPAVAKLSVEVFIKHVLPPLHKSFTPAKVAKVLAGLKVKHRGQKSAAYSAREKRWTAFDEIEKATEYATYQALATISNQITAEVRTVFKGKAPKQLFDFVNEGNSVPVSVVRDSTSKPDGYFMLREEFRQTKGKPKDESKATSKTKNKTKDKAYWMDIGPSGEYKLDNTEKAVKDDLEKILWNVTHTMREDARRRFTFAFTIEDTNMHLWYASRADILMSNNFDFMEEPEILLRFFLAFLYATETDAGWDPTMECVWDGSTPQYIITVHDAEKKKHRYKTVGTLSDIGAGSLRGRGTRVWKVVPYGTSATSKTDKVKATEFVLKDCWVDQGAAKEGDIVNDILGDAKKKVLEWEEIVAQHEHNPEELAGFPDEVKFTNDDLEELKKSLLLPSIHGEVLLGSVRSQSDKTLDRANLWHGDQVPYHRLWHSVAPRDAKSEAEKRTLQEKLKGEHRSVYLCHKGRDEPIMYNQKVHYRVVFEEVCRAIKDEIFLHRAYMYLAMTCQALELLHKTGWLHRDISVGNILITSEGTVKLADFEYAKRMETGDGTRHDICTGTRDFMAIEVQKTKYLFRPLDSDSLAPKNGPRRRRDFRLQENMSKDDAQLQTNIDIDSRPDVIKDIPWLYNPIHDMESVMWLSNYFTIGKNIEFPTTPPDTIKVLDEAITPEPQDARDKRIIRQDIYSSNLFYQTGYREQVIKSLSGWDELIHPVLVKVGILRILNTVRSRLVARYVEVEKNIALSPQILAGPDLYQGMIDDFIDACRQVELLSSPAVMEDLAQEADRLQEEAALPVAQIQNMSIQDGAPTDTAVTGSTKQQTQLRNSSNIDPTPSGASALTFDADSLNPSAGSSKAVKPAARQRAPPIAPTRTQPQRTVRSRN